MSKYYGRQWEIKIDNEVYIPRIELNPKLEARDAGLERKMTFTVLTDFGGFISYADIALYNLSADGANRVVKKDRLLTFSAGYKDDPYGLIFEGNIQNVLYERNGADTITRVIARGGKANEVQSISKPPAKSEKVTDLIRACVKALNYEIEMEDADFANEPLYLRGKLLSGDPRVYLDELARAHKFSYVTELKRVVVVKDGSVRLGNPIVVSQETGMEGIPEITEVGADVVTRLNPSIKIGGRVDVQSNLKTFNFSNLYFQDIPEAAGTGIYRIFKLRHTGDTWGDTWSTKVTGFR